MEKETTHVIVSAIHNDG